MSLTKRRTVQAASNTQKSMENYNNNWPYYAKKYVNDRTNSLAEVKRVYIYLLGNRRGLGSFEAHLKKLQPDAKQLRGKLVEWHFDTEFLWDVFTSHERLGKIIAARQIDSWEELSSKAYVY